MASVTLAVDVAAHTREEVEQSLLVTAVDVAVVSNPGWGEDTAPATLTTGMFFFGDGVVMLARYFVTVISTVLSGP